MADPWEHILACVGYSGEPCKKLSADAIKKAKNTWKGGASQFEPRLLCYQTSSQSRPNALKSRDLCVLPVENGEYVLIRANIYQPLVYDEVTTIPIRKNTDSLVLNLGQSEMSLIDNLRYAGVFERPEILSEPILYGSLLGGRHRTGTFTTILGNQELTVQGVQFEVDSCYETKNSVLILEGKSSPKPIDSFNIRQLYYPYRYMKNSIGDKKKILCGFVHQLGKIIHIWLYTFQDYMRMDSVQEVGHYKYQFE